MADIIATELDAHNIGGSSVSYTSNLCCTKSRAEALNCIVNGSYSSNLLVCLKDLSSGRHSIRLYANGSYTIDADRIIACTDSNTARTCLFKNISGTKTISGSAYIVLEEVFPSEVSGFSASLPYIYSLGNTTATRTLSTFNALYTSANVNYAGGTFGFYPCGTYSRNNTIYYSGGSFNGRLNYQIIFSLDLARPTSYSFLSTLRNIKSILI